MEQTKIYSMENSELHKQLLMDLDEFGISSEPLSYHEAAKKYYDFLFEGISEVPQKIFGDYTIQTTDYEMITDKNISAALALIKTYKPKKFFSGFKLYCNVFASVKFCKDIRAEVLPPKKILWQISGVSEDVVKDITDRLSPLLNMSLKAVSKDGRAL